MWENFEAQYASFRIRLQGKLIVLVKNLRAENCLLTSQNPCHLDSKHLVTLATIILCAKTRLRKRGGDQFDRLILS